MTAGGGYRLLAGGAADAATPLPSPGQSGIKHVVVVMMENRSFDHFLGWLPQVNPAADGKQAGLTYRDRYRVPHQTHHLTEFASCGFQDPDHSYEGGRIQLNGGRCDGWLRSGLNDSLSIGYYEQADLQFLGQAAPAWTTFDRYFSAVMAETYPNRFYLHCAQDRPAPQRRHPSDHVHVPTHLGPAEGRGGQRQVLLLRHPVHLPAPGARHRARGRRPLCALPGTFFADAAAGTLPAVSFVDPRFLDEDDGLSNDDHPHADVRAGEVFMNQVYDAVRTGPGWKSTVLVITYDEWGGFFDHVPPPAAHDVARRPACAASGCRPS